MVASLTLASAASAQQLPTTSFPNKIDAGKHFIERPMKSFFKSGEIPQPIMRDASKSGIEAPVKSMMRYGIPTELLKSNPVIPMSSVRPTHGRFNATSIEVINSLPSSGVTRFPRQTVRKPTNAEAIVESNSANSVSISQSKPSQAVPVADKTSTGLVVWHTDMTNAMKQSARSGKPVLVFHMMGSLDDRFC